MPPVRVPCTNCGGKIPLPDRYAKAKLRCVHCGYYAEVPPEMRSLPPAEPEARSPFDEPKRKPIPQPNPEIPAPKPTPKAKAKRRIDPRDFRPDFSSDESAGPPLLAGTQEVHDDEAVPYEVPGSGLKKCPECHGELPLDATLCVHCGINLVTGEAAPEREVKAMNRIYEEGFPFQWRLQIFIVLQFVNVVFLIGMMILTGKSFTSPTSLLSNLMGHLTHIALQAFLLGSYDTLIVKRNNKGQAWLTRVRRIAFLKLPAWKIPWKRSIMVGIVPTAGSGIFTWIIMIYLCMMGFLPGIAFYFVVIRPERYQICLCDVYGGVEEIIFRTKSQEWAEEITAAVAQATGLQQKKYI